MKLSRYSTFIELKSANDLTKGPDEDSIREYKVFIDLLMASTGAQKTKNTKSRKNRKGNG